MIDIVDLINVVLSGIVLIAAASVSPTSNLVVMLLLSSLQGVGVVALISILVKTDSNFSKRLKFWFFYRN